MQRLLLVWWAVATGCVHPDSVTCADGRVCPGDTVCDAVHAQCVTRAQKTACGDTMVDGDRCTAKDFDGICDQGVCIAGCGDSVQDGEECDDGNLASHDGCSSACLLETPTWIEWQSPWTPRSRHGAAFMIAQNKLVVFGGTDETGPIAQHWERDANTAWNVRDIPRPSARVNPAMAYDELHDKIVLFGGSTATGISSADVLGDTWIYDGSAWTKLTTTTAPSARTWAAMAYAGNGKLVLFGGVNSAYLDDTWEFDGATNTWTEITVALINRPTPRRSAAMAWAPFTVNPRVVMFGGVGSVTSPDSHYEYTSAGGWTKITLGSSDPKPRFSHQMAFSPFGTTDVVVMFGGGSNSTPFSDSWEYDGTTWTPVIDLISPPARSEATMTTVGPAAVLIGGNGVEGPLADVWEYTSGWGLSYTPGSAPIRGDHELVYDGSAKKTTIIAGYREPNALFETYVFDGVRWSQGDSLVQTPSAPAYKSRFRFNSAYDASRNRIVVFGGKTYGSQVLTDTQVHTGGGWMNVAGTEPPARYGGAMAYAGSQQKVILFGGRTSGSQNLADTWAFGDQWTQLPFTGPAASEDAAMAYDPKTDRIVLFGENGETWGLTTAGWSKIDVTEAPVARTGAAMTYSPELERVVLYGGKSATDLLTDLWMLDGDHWVEITPAGAAPIGRTDPRLVEHAPFRQLMLSAGTLASGRRVNDTWFFQFRSDTPDEICANAIDDDGDKRVDLLDLDCRP